MFFRGRFNCLFTQQQEYKREETGTIQLMLNSIPGDATIKTPLN